MKFYQSCATDPYAKSCTVSDIDLKWAGSSLFEPNALELTWNDGDLNNPNLKLYEACASDPYATSCTLSDPEVKSDDSQEWLLFL